MMTTQETLIRSFFPSDPAGQYKMQPVRDFEKCGCGSSTPAIIPITISWVLFLSILSLQPDDVLAVAFEYTYLGQVYQVGEFTNNLPPCRYLQCHVPEDAERALQLRSIFRCGT